jgi:hypothetical protein
MRDIITRAWINIPDLNHALFVTVSMISTLGDDICKWKNTQGI